MMDRDAFEALFGGKGEVDEDLSLLAALGRLARERRPTLEYAADVLEAGMEGGSFEVPDERPLELAAAEPGHPFPARYRGAGYTVVLLRGAGGLPRARLDAGGGPVELIVGGKVVRVGSGEPAEIPWISEAPATLGLVPEGGEVITLERDPER